MGAKASLETAKKVLMENLVMKTWIVRITSDSPSDNQQITGKRPYLAKMNKQSRKKRENRLNKISKSNMPKMKNFSSLSKRLIQQRIKS